MRLIMLKLLRPAAGYDYTYNVSEELQILILAQKRRTRGGRIMPVQKGRICRLARRKQNVIIAPAASCPGVPGMMKTRIEVINNLYLPNFRIFATKVMTNTKSDEDEES